MFYDLYKDSTASKGQRPIRAADGNIYIKYPFPADEKCVTSKRSIVEIEMRGENILKNGTDVMKYKNIMENDLCKNILKLETFNSDFIVHRRLLSYLTKKSIKGEIKVDNHHLLHAIDFASGGGCLIAEKGTHNGNYFLYDIVNSYNEFFIDFDIPSNPQFFSVDKIKSKNFFCLYRLKILDDNFSKEKKWKFRTNRTWFAKWDIDIFDMFDIKYELINEKNNCVKFMERIKSDFEWMEKLNEEKQNTEEPMKKSIIKNLLSSFWGNMCRYNCLTEEEYGKEIPDNYFHKTGAISGDDLYIHPEKFYLYSIAICKPFVLAYARYRLLKQINKIENKGYKVIYAHTDSIITDCPEKYFKTGSNIGDWKLEKKSENNVVINNIASKIFN